MGIKYVSEMSYYFICTKNFKFVMSIEPTSTYVNLLHYRCPKPRTFCPRIVAIFMEVFLEGYIAKNIKINLQI
jgi:hypothetical protein